MLSVYTATLNQKLPLTSMATDYATLLLFQKLGGDGSMNTHTHTHTHRTEKNVYVRVGGIQNPLNHLDIAGF